MSHRTTQLRSTLMIIVFGVCCGHPARTSEITHEQSVKVPNSPVASATVGLQDPALLCKRIPEMKVFPIKGDKGEDPIYDAFIDSGEAVVPCLIEKVTDATKIRDPRQEPSFPDIEIRTGDIAYFLLVDITKLHFTELLPDEVKQKYKEVGVYAYFKLVENPANRKRLRDNLEAWYSANSRK